jgi:DNA-binding NtrC family response regulator
MARVLVAEDDFEMRSMVVEALRKDGHEVTELADGMALLAEIVDDRAGDPRPRLDLVVSDIRMPGCNALEVLEWMGDVGWGVRFILMTAFGDDEMRSRARRLGAMLFDKPLSLDALRAEVNRLTAERLPGADPGGGAP